MLPIWLDILLTTITFLLMLFLGLELLNLKRRYSHLILIAILVAGVNVSLSHWFSNPLIKMVIPIFSMIGLHTYLSKINMLKSAIAIVMGVNIYFFLESVIMLIATNLLNIFPETYMSNSLINTLGVLFIVCFGLGIIILLRKFDWKLYNLTQIADNSKEHKRILIAALLFIGTPLLIYWSYYWYISYVMAYIDDIMLIFNVLNFVFLLYFFVTCFVIRYVERDLEKIYKAKLNNALLTLLNQFLETEFKVKEDIATKINSVSNLLKQGKYSGIQEILYTLQDYVRPKTQINLIPIPQLRMFFQNEDTLAREREVDFILQVSDLSGFEAYNGDIKLEEEIES